MLKDEERREIENEITRYPAREAAAIDALKIVQRHRGWISDESIQDIAVQRDHAVAPSGFARSIRSRTAAGSSSRWRTALSNTSAIAVRS